MIRVTLLEDFGAPVELKYGYEIMVPMSFGGPSPDVMMEFRARREDLPAQPLVWTLDWRDEEKRSVVMQDQGPAVHYFGDPRAASPDHPDVRDRKVPNFNDERIRVAMMWGDYVYSDRHGPYTSVRIRLPLIPKVVIHQANANGSTIAATAFYPHTFFKFEELLAADHEAQYAAALARYRPAGFDPTTLSDDDLDKLATALRLRAQKAKVS